MGSGIDGISGIGKEAILSHASLPISNFITLDLFRAWKEMKFVVSTLDSLGLWHIVKFPLEEDASYCNGSDAQGPKMRMKVIWLSRFPYIRCFFLEI